MGGAAKQSALPAEQTDETVVNAGKPAEQHTDVQTTKDGNTVHAATTTPTNAAEVTAKAAPTSSALEGVTVTPALVPGESRKKRRRRSPAGLMDMLMVLKPPLLSSDRWKPIYERDGEYGYGPNGEELDDTFALPTTLEELFADEEDFHSDVVESWDGNGLAYPHRTGFRPVSCRMHSPYHSVNRLDRNS